MPKSKRNRIVHLTKVKKKTKEWKEGIIATVRGFLEEYPACYVFKYRNMRNDRLKELRDELRDTSRFVLGSNKLLSVAVGRSEADEPQQGSHSISPHIQGNCGLFFTKLPHQEVVQLFSAFEAADYARTGSVSTQSLHLPEGPVLGPFEEPLAHTLEPLLRKNGMPTKLDKGVVTLLADYTVCKEGDRLTPQQVALLRVFEVKMAVFRFTLMGRWTAADGIYEVLATEGSDVSDDEEKEGEEEEGGDEDFPAMPADMELPAALRET